MRTTIPSLLVLCALMLPAGHLAAQTPDPYSQLPAYQPTQVKPTPGAGYLMPDGSIRIIGLGDMQGVVAKLNDFFAKTHPGTRFTYVKSDSLGSIYSLIFDATAFAPAGIVYPSNLTYTDIVHGPPFSIRVAHGSLNPSAEVSPLAIIVNRSNPLSKLSMAQAASIFTQPARAHVFSRWSQLGIAGPLAAQAIHPCGLPWTDHYPSEDTNFGEFFFFRKLNAAPPVETYTMLKTYADVVAAVSADPSAIGVTTLNRVTDAVKVIAISDNDLKLAMTGTTADIRSGQYPLDRDLYLYARVVSGKPLDPFVREYLRMVLSREGQEIVGREAHGYIPLNSLEVQEDLATFQ
jgi:phosphate transport system substrate-binding protein